MQSGILKAGRLTWAVLLLAAWAHECAGQLVAQPDADDSRSVNTPLASSQHGQQWSGVYPHLTMHNQEGECGTGAVVLWQGSLWAITYAPHRPGGSTDKLYEVTPDLQQHVFGGSVGGTPANRMIHRESNQLLIGPYLIDGDKRIRVIPPTAMFGRLTGNARHLIDPAGKVYYATMEEGLYEVDVQSLGVTCLIRDGNSGAPDVGVPSQLPGYHGKGLYSGQQRLVYANNGDQDPRVKVDPTVPSGALATWHGDGDWKLVRRNQFTEVTGPGGIFGSSRPDSDPVWAMGWDARSLILAVLENERWHYYRLPKGSHSYDGAHGWNTEWPRIREIGEDSLLATMHGTFWRFPANFSVTDSAGIAPRSNYLKVVGDFCRWKDRLVLGCDDSAKSEFLNTRAFKAKHGSPGQSNSNLWFVEPARLDQLGPAIGRGSVWLRDDVQSGEVSDPYLFSGYEHRQLHLTHAGREPVTFVLEVDRKGTNQWQPQREITVEPGAAVSHIFTADDTGCWIRLTSQQAASGVTAHFQYRNHDPREAANAALFDGIARAAEPAEPASFVRSYGLMRSLSHDRLGLVTADNAQGRNAAYYELNPQMELVPAETPSITAFVSVVAQPRAGISVDDASVIVIEDGRRFRLPKNVSYLDVDNASQPDSLDDYLARHLAIGARVTVSSTHAGYEASRAVDGRIGDDDRWIGSNEGEVWIELDLGREVTMQSLWVISGWQSSPDYVAASFDVQIYHDGQWQTVPDGKVRNNSDVRREIVFSKPVTARRLRLVSDTDDYFRIYEIAPFANRIDVPLDASSFSTPRICREVATERDLLNVHGTFYELPARNAQGLAKLRPIATHNLAIHDFCSHNGLLLLTGLKAESSGHHIIRSNDGKAALWAGVVDDLWQLGKPRGVGGPWYETLVEADQPSDPYLMTGYDRKRVSITSSSEATIHLEVDVDGTGLWIPARSFKLTAGQTIDYEFPAGFSAYWLRAVSNSRTQASVTLTYD